MFNPRQRARTHEDIFIERYHWLRSLALHLAENDLERAEDLVQDAFIHFIIARPDLESIINLDGYLYSVMRNLHLSHERRASRSRLQQLSIFEYDSVALALRAVGSIDRMQTQEELRRVCQYSCARKETSRAASILILRFFHGYFPSEIARITGANRRAVDERLRIARKEARLYLDDPARLRFMKDATPPASPQTDTTRDAADIMVELRRMIFNSRRGDCLNQSELENIYKHKEGAQLSIQHLAHIVSCCVCLEAVNSLLGLSTLNERHPPDMIGKDSMPKGKRTGGTSGGASGKGGGASLNKYRRSAREVYEHRPRELYFLVNGFILGSQKINSELSEQTLDISIAEGVGFVEVCSEQDVRLFFLQVEPPPHGAVKQPARVDLSDGRSLDLTLTFDSTWPTLHAVYHDPLLKSETLNEELAGEMTQASYAAEQQQQEASAGEEHAPFRPASFVKRMWQRCGGTHVGLRPGLVTAALALLIITALVFVKMRISVVNAGALLQSSVAAEEKRTSNTEQVFHSSIRFEEWADQGKRLIARNRIEVWQSPARELKVRRVFDEQGQLLAGEWIRADGTSTLYNHGDAPEARVAPEAVAKALLETGEIWRLEVSAKGFSALLKETQGFTARQNGDTYIIEYHNNEQTAADVTKLIEATLTLRKSDLHAIEQRLIIERGGERHEYRFTEEMFEKYPKSYIGRSFFIPDPELSRPLDKKESDKPKAQDGVMNSAGISISEASSGVASPELEIEVAYLLNRIKANLGEQVSVTRTTGGALRVEALVETEGRKEEILRALGSIINNPAVKVEVRTVSEAARSQPDETRKRGAAVREVTVANNQIPAYAELHAYFSARVVGDEGVEQEINSYSNRVMNRSRQALLRAAALKRLVLRFSPEEFRALDPEAQKKWLAMIREHALAYQREVAALRQELRAVFGGAYEDAGEASGDTNPAQAAERLLQLSYANDDAVRSAFTISADGRTTASIKSRQFWRSLATAEKLAAAIDSAYGR